MLVDFLVVGAQKSGTTALDKYLREHDEIEMAIKKEVHFFDNEKNFVKKVDYSKYHSSFNNHQDAALKGEITPIYMYWSDSIKRIWEYNPNMKIIVVLRNPIERAYSHWNMERDRNADFLSFSEAIRTECQRCKEALPLQHRVYSYVDRGFYSEQIRRIHRFFSEDQVLIIKQESLKFDLSNTLSKICEFLGVKDFSSIQNKDVHSRKYTSKISKEDFIYLKGLFSGEIKTLENILGWDCSDWLDLPES